MTNKERFESAKEIYASYGVDVETALQTCICLLYTSDAADD